MMNRLREYQYENDMTVTELGDILGVHRTYISSVMTGKKLPGPALEYRIKKLLESSTDKQINKTATDKPHQQKINPCVADDCASEICVTVKPHQKLIPKISHKSLHVQLQSRLKTDLCKANK